MSDRRVRLKPRGSFSDLDGPMRPLRETGNALMFPYTPDISMAQQPDYQSLNLTHTNQDWYYYVRTPSQQISISNGVFTANTPAEASYMFAAIHFFRSYVKMEYGLQSRNANPPSGTPPRMMWLNGYGNGIFNNLPVILKDWAYSLPNDIDYVKVPPNEFGHNFDAWVPLKIVFTCNLIVQHTPVSQRDDFNLTLFKLGTYIRNPPATGGWI